MINSTSAIKQATPINKNCFSWGATIAGALVGAGLGFLLNLFNLALGLTAFTTTQEGVITFVVGGFLGLLIGGMVATFVAGCVAGYLAHPIDYTEKSGILYGFLAWFLALFLTALLFFPMTSYLSANYSVLILPQNMNEMHSAMHEALKDPQAVAEAVKTTNEAGKAIFAIFVLACLSALAGCLGGYCGMRCKASS